MVAPTNQPPTGQRVPDLEGGAGEHGDDLTSDLRPRPRRAAAGTRNAPPARACRPEASKQSDARRPRFVDQMRPISERPAEVDTRQVPGHWEGDLIIGALGGSAIATLVERTTRFVILAQFGRKRTTEALRNALIQDSPPLAGIGIASAVADLGPGRRMAEHRAFSVATDFDVYFADPGSPWQRASNENANGLLSSGSTSPKAPTLPRTASGVFWKSSPS